MTQREFLNKVIAIPNVAEDIKTEAEALIAKLDNKNEQRKGKQTKVQKDNEPIAKAIVEYLTDKGEVLGVDIATALNLSTSKLNGVAGNLWKEGVLVKGKAKVKGKGEMTTYALAVTDEDEGEDTAEVSAE
jgi:single-stranded DNA-specific DHH superfamily exonuclease